MARKGKRNKRITEYGTIDAYRKWEQVIVTAFAYRECLKTDATH